MMDIHESFDTYKFNTWNDDYRGAWAKGSAYKCGGGCDFIYFVGNCGGTMEESKCQWCQRTIGGTNHKIHVREGHENLSDVDAKVYIQNLLEKYEREAP